MIESKRGKKTSSEKVVEVITAKIENPDLSLRDIEKKTGVNRQTTNKILKEQMDEVVTSCDKKRSLMDVNLSIIEIWSKIIEEEVKAISEKKGELKINSLSDLRQLSWTIEDHFKRNQLLEGKPTENHNIIWGILSTLWDNKVNLTK